MSDKKNQSFGESMTEIMVYDKDSPRPSGPGGTKDDCFFCEGESRFVVLGQKKGSTFGGYVERRTCQRVDCLIKAIKTVKSETGL